MEVLALAPQAGAAVRRGHSTELLAGWLGAK